MITILNHRDMEMVSILIDSNTMDNIQALSFSLKFIITRQWKHIKLIYTTTVCNDVSVGVLFISPYLCGFILLFLPCGDDLLFIYHALNRNYNYWLIT